MLAPFGITVEALPESVQLPPEDGDTFEANARPKARAAALALGRPAIADDSGIEAEALNGAPGVRSARYAGERASDQENLDKLLREVPAGSALRYVCALAFVDPSGLDPGGDRIPAQDGAGGGPEEHVFFGYCAGVMAGEPRGSRGFGYDPAFLPTEGPAGLTMAELSDEDKDAISHRGRAIRSFAEWLTRTRPAGQPR